MSGALRKTRLRYFFGHGRAVSQRTINTPCVVHSTRTRVAHITRLRVAHHGRHLTGAVENLGASPPPVCLCLSQERPLCFRLISQGAFRQQRCGLRMNDHRFLPPTAHHRGDQRQRLGVERTDDAAMTVVERRIGIAPELCAAAGPQVEHGQAAPLPATLEQPGRGVEFSAGLLVWFKSSVGIGWLFP
jgi:hypothetical protein